MSEYGAPERKFQQPEKGLVVSEGHVVEGYASLFGKTDQGGDIVQKGAYAASLKRLAARLPGAPGTAGYRPSTPRPR